MFYVLYPFVTYLLTLPRTNMLYYILLYRHYPILYYSYLMYDFCVVHIFEYMHFIM
jgi:hypothetical protein